MNNTIYMKGDPELKSVGTKETTEENQFVKSPKFVAGRPVKMSIWANKDYDLTKVKSE